MCSKLALTAARVDVPQKRIQIAYTTGHAIGLNLKPKNWQPTNHFISENATFLKITH